MKTTGIALVTSSAEGEVDLSVDFLTPAPKASNEDCATAATIALNTPTSVLRIRDRYYACDNAVWYVADSPTGPWLLADAVPADDLEQIPPSAPVYNVKYVQIYDATPDVVYEGYTSGYYGSDAVVA